jgi:hypothetical protein
MSPCHFPKENTPVPLYSTQVKFKPSTGPTRFYAICLSPHCTQGILAAQHDLPQPHLLSLCSPYAPSLHLPEDPQTFPGLAPSHLWSSNFTLSEASPTHSPRQSCHSALQPTILFSCPDLSDWFVGIVCSP